MSHPLLRTLISEMVESYLEEATHITHSEKDHLTTISGDRGEDSNYKRHEAKQLKKHLENHGIKVSHNSATERDMSGKYRHHTLSIYHHDPEHVAKALNSSKTFSSKNNPVTADHVSGKKSHNNLGKRFHQDPWEDKDFKTHDRE